MRFQRLLDLRKVSRYHACIMHDDVAFIKSRLSAIFNLVPRPGELEILAKPRELLNILSV